MKIHLTLLGALLVPAAAFAQPNPKDPAAPAPLALPAPIVAMDTAPASAPAPAPASYTTNDPEYQEVTDPFNAPMFTSGALVFAASYGASVIVAATSDNDRGNNRLYVPLVGPWLALNDRGSCDITKSSCDHETTAKVLLIADGVFQAAGVLGMIDSVLWPSSHRVVVTRSAKLDTKIHVRPSMVHGDPGISVFGRF